MKQTICTFSGLEFDVFAPVPDTILIEDIATALSRAPRFAGHTRVPYNVALHSVHVARMVPLALRLEALLHDASEAYMVDMPAPIKQFLPEYKKIEDVLQSAIYDKFGVHVRHHDLIKVADLKAREWEQWRLMRHGDWWTCKEPDRETVACSPDVWYSASDSEGLFLDMFEELMEA